MLFSSYLCFFITIPVVIFLLTGAHSNVSMLCLNASRHFVGLNTPLVNGLAG